MKAKTVLILLLTLLGVVFLGTCVFLATSNPALLNPQGLVAQKQFELLRLAVFLSLFGLGPALLLTFFVVWKFREENSEKNYLPNFGEGSKLQVVFWLLPLSIIMILAFFTLKNTHDLDPFKVVASDKKPLDIQVVALRWKWLFIYPKQNVASVNFVQFPENTPIRFKLTADEAPMNSFWIPQLGGQMYAMTGMETQLNLMASSTGEFSGLAAEISGPGFSKMRFTAKSSTQDEFEQWVNEVKTSSKTLTSDEYNSLIKPSEITKVVYFSRPDDLYDTILEKYMPVGSSPTDQHSSMEHYH